MKSSAVSMVFIVLLENILKKHPQTKLISSQSKLYLKLLRDIFCVWSNKGSYCRTCLLFQLIFRIGEHLKSISFKIFHAHINVPAYHFTANGNFRLWLFLYKKAPRFFARFLQFRVKENLMIRYLEKRYYEKLFTSA